MTASESRAAIRTEWRGLHEHRCLELPGPAACDLDGYVYRAMVGGDCRRGDRPSRHRVGMKFDLVFASWGGLVPEDLELEEILCRRVERRQCRDCDEKNDARPGTRRAESRVSCHRYRDARRKRVTRPAPSAESRRGSECPRPAWPRYAGAIRRSSRCPTPRRRRC